MGAKRIKSMLSILKQTGVAVQAQRDAAPKDSLFPDCIMDQAVCFGVECNECPFHTLADLKTTVKELCELLAKHEK